MSVNIHYTIKQLQSLSNNLYNSVLVHLKINCNKLILICNSINYFLIILPLMPQLVQAVILPQHGVSVGLKRFGEFKAPVEL